MSKCLSDCVSPLLISLPAFQLYPQNVFQISESKGPPKSVHHLSLPPHIIHFTKFYCLQILNICPFFSAVLCLEHCFLFFHWLSLTLFSLGSHSLCLGLVAPLLCFILPCSSTSIIALIPFLWEFFFFSFSLYTYPPWNCKGRDHYNRF